MLELAKVEAGHLSNVTGAVDYYGEILSRTPNHADAITALETILVEPDFRARAAELLEPAYRTTRDLPRLAECLKIRLETVLDGDRRIAAWKEIATIEAHLEHPAEALEARGNAWLEDVTNTETLVELESQAAQCSGFEQLVGWLEKGAELAMDPELCGDLHAFRANILEARLAKPEAAMDAWRQALEARPDHQDSFLALERLLADAGKIAELCEVLEKHSEVEMEPPERQVLVKRVATLYEYPLAQLPKAISSWRSVLDMDQNDQEALDALIRLFKNTSDDTSLVEILLRKIDTCRDPKVIRALRFQTAEVYDQKLTEPSEAGGQLRAVLSENPDDVEALEMLGSLYLREKQYVEFVEVLDERARLTTNPAERWDLAFRAASVTQSSLLDLSSAVQRYHRILDENPSHKESREALWTLARGEDQRVLALDVLEPVLRTNKEWNALCDLFEIRLTTVDLPNDRVTILADKATIQELELGDRPGAFTTYARALAEEPGNETIREAIERLAVATGNVPGLALVYEERIKESYDVSFQQYFTSRLATLCEGVLGKPGRAVELWSTVASLPGAETEALAHLESLLRFLGRTSELADVLEREAEAAQTPQEQAEFWTQLGLILLGPGDISFSPIEEPGRAIEAFRSALDRNPHQEKALSALRTLVKHKHPPIEALDILIPLAEERGDYAELAGLLDIRVNVVDDSNERAALYIRIADIQETRLASPFRALDALGQALTNDPGSETTAERIEQLAASIGKPLEAARRLADVLSGVDPMLFTPLALRAARLYLATMTPANEQIALELYGKVLTIEPENALALESLEVIYRHLKDSQHLAEILERRGALELSPSRRMELYAEAARSHERAGNLSAAIAAWRAAKEGNEFILEPLDELARLMEVVGDHAELVEILREKSQHLDDNDARADLLVRVSELQAGPLEDKEAAVDTLKEALDYSPAHPLALAVLVEIEEMRGDFLALEEALLRQSASLSGEEQYAVLAKLAQNAREHMHDPERALVYLQQILSSSGDNRYAFAESERLLTDLMRWHELIELLERLAEVEARVGNTAGELSCRVKIASLWGEKLGAEENALLALEEVLKRAPNHCPSLLAVARIHQSAERWEDATSALEKAALVATTAEEKADLYYRRAKIAEAIGQSVEQVVPLYQAAIAQAPTFEPALVGFEAIARKQNDPHLLSQALTQRINREKDETRLKNYITELAELYLGPLAAPAEAIAPLDRLLQFTPDDTGIQEKLAGAFIGAGRVDEGEYAMETLITRLTKDRRMKEVARLKCQLGSFAETRGDLRLAQQRYAAAFQIDPTQSVVLGSLARLALRQNDPESSRRYLRTLLLQNFDEKAAGITKAEVFLELGRLHLLSGEKAKARNMFERGLETDPKNEELKKALAETPR
jgi:tetratricopeptide (TPR) repeat protein